MWQRRVWGVVVDDLCSLLVGMSLECGFGG